MNRTGLFLWVPRTGGSSVWAVIERRQMGHVSQRCVNRPFSPDKTLTTFQHASIAALLDDETITAEWLGRQWKFTFVRHPAARLVSVFHHLKQGGREHRASVAGLEFPRFVEMACAGDVPPIDRDSTVGLGYANRQTDWMRMGQTWLPDYVGRLEDQPQSFLPVCEALGIRGNPQQSNQSIHKPWRDYYDGRRLQLVQRRYAEEIDLGKYSIGG